jgi:hypothetical protein
MCGDSRAPMQHHSRAQKQTAGNGRRPTINRSSWRVEIACSENAAALSRKTRDGAGKARSTPHVRLAARAGFGLRSQTNPAGGGLQSATRGEDGGIGQVAVAGGHRFPAAYCRCANHTRCELRLANGPKDKPELTPAEPTCWQRHCQGSAPKMPTRASWLVPQAEGRTCRGAAPVRKRCHRNSGSCWPACRRRPCARRLASDCFFALWKQRDGLGQARDAMGEMPRVPTWGCDGRHILRRQSKPRARSLLNDLRGSDRSLDDAPHQSHVHKRLERRQQGKDSATHRPWPQATVQRTLREDGGRTPVFLSRAPPARLVL